MDSERVCNAVGTQTLRRVEAFSDVVIYDHGKCYCVQVRQVFSLHDDGTHSHACYRVDDPMCGDSSYHEDPVQYSVLSHRFDALLKLALGITSCTAWVASMC